MQDHPDKLTLLQGVGTFLATELAPKIDDRDLRFRARIAAYLIQIVAMELAFDEQQDDAELTRLGVLLDEETVANLPASQRKAELRRLNDALVDRIRSGDVDEALFDHVTATLREKLAVVQPRFDTRLDVE